MEQFQWFQTQQRALVEDMTAALNEALTDAFQTQTKQLAAANEASNEALLDHHHHSPTTTHQPEHASPAGFRAATAATAAATTHSICAIDCGRQATLALPACHPPPPWPCHRAAHGIPCLPPPHGISLASSPHISTTVPPHAPNMHYRIIIACILVELCKVQAEIQCSDWELHAL